MRGAASKALLPLAALMLGGAAPPSPAVSLISARWQGSQFLNCDGDEELCFQPIVRAHLTSVVTLSGPAIPESLRPMLRVHADPIREYDTVLAVWRASDGSWQAWRLTIVKPGDEACVSNDNFASLNMARPWMSWRKKNETRFHTR